MKVVVNESTEKKTSKLGSRWKKRNLGNRVKAVRSMVQIIGILMEAIG